MPKLEAEVEFEVWCSCGAGLCRQTKANGTSVTVEPCESCLDTAREEGKEDGDTEGYERGREEGYRDGYEAGRHKGFEEGKAAAIRVLEEEGR